MADSPEPERELDADAASAALSKVLRDRLRGLEPKDGIQRKRYLLGPFEDPSDGPKVLMSLESAIDDLRSRFEDTDCTQLGDELTYRVIELSDAEVDALPEL